MSNQDSNDRNFCGRFENLMSRKSVRRSSNDGDSTKKNNENETKCSGIGGRGEFPELKVSKLSHNEICNDTKIDDDILLCCLYQQSANEKEIDSSSLRSGGRGGILQMLRKNSAEASQHASDDNSQSGIGK